VRNRYFPGRVTVVLLMIRKKMSGNDTLLALFKVRHDVLAQRYSVIGTLLAKNCGR